jgi:ribosomal-protein-alanine N-acetyltransferase
MIALDLQLEGPGVLLRPSTAADYRDHQRILSDAVNMEFLRFMANPRGWSIEQVREREQAFARLRSQQRGVEFTVVERKSQAVVGSCGFHLLSQLNRNAAFGLILDHSVWGKGVSAECHLLCFDWAFGEQRIHRIEMETHEGNLRMRGFIERVEVPLEFVRKDVWLEEGKFHSSCGYAFYEAQWPSVRQRLAAIRDRQRARS